MTLSLPFRPFAMRRRPDASGIDASGNAGHNLPYGTLAVLAVLVALVPVWGVRILPMPDYPSHLARLYLLTTGDANPILDGIYGIRWEPIPNLAMDLVALPLARILALTDAGRVFVTLCVLLWLTGPLAIQWALYRRIGPAPLAAAFFAFNVNFFMGFLNYVFGVGLAFLVLALWIGMARPDRQHREALRLAVLAVGATAVYFCHLVAFAILALAVLGYEAAPFLRPRRPDLRAATRVLVPAALCFAPAALLFLLARPAGVAGDGGLSFQIADTIGARLGAALQKQLERPDFLVLGALAALSVGLLATRQASVARRMVPVLGLLTLAAIVAPVEGLGGWGAHLRLPPVIGALFFASLDFRPARRTGLALAAIIVAVLGYRVTRLDLSWRHLDREVSEFRAALAALEPGAPLLLANDLAGRSPDGYDSRVYWHWDEFAVIDRSAFVPMLFMIPGQQIVHPVGPWRQIAAATTKQGMPASTRTLGALADGDADPQELEHWAYLRDWPCRFRYLTVLHEPRPADPLPDLLEPLRRGPLFTIYRIRPPASCAP